MGKSNESFFFRNKWCNKGKCENPCSNPRTCGINAQCSVLNHNALCSCPAGFVGNPRVECLRDVDQCQPNPCGANSRCIDLVGSFDCKCDSGCQGNARQGCTCPPVEVDGCHFKICGPNAQCRSENGVGKCYCPQQFPHGNPDQSCSSRPGGKKDFHI